ncbi:MAG: lysylphosphatidylglycerol synthase transmembrane domain-containing protein [Candidatus Binataceae bacterium]
MSAQPNLKPAPERPPVVKKRHLIWRVLPYAVTAVIFAFILYHIPLAKAGTAFLHVPILEFIGVFFPLSLIYLLADTLSLKWVVQRFDCPISFSEALPIRASMYLAGLVNSNLGFAGLAYYLKRKHHVNFLQGLSSVLFIAFVDVYTIFLFAGPALLFYTPETSKLADVISTMRLVFAAGWAFLIALIVIAFLARRNLAISNWIKHTRIGKFTGSFLKATPLDYAVLLIIKSIAFACALAAQYWTLVFYGITIPVAKLVALLPLVYLAGAIPITIGQLGPIEGAWIVLFAANAPADKLLAYSLAIHLIFMACLAAIGFVFFRHAKRDLGWSK